MTQAHPRIRLKPREHHRVVNGHPWVYANEIQLDAATRALAPGEIVTVESADRKPLGTASFNLHSLIAARLFDLAPDAALDAEFFAGRLRRALLLRQQFFAQPYYRLLHAEGDGLPGFVIDRFGQTLVMQTNTAGAEGLLAPVLDALDAVLAPERVLLRNDSSVRALEGRPREVRWAKAGSGGPGPKVEVLEGGLRFAVDAEAGQKTGWFFDLAPARAMVAPLGQNKRVLDLYCHTGGFALAALAAGAEEALAVDSSESSLKLALQSAEGNGLGTKLRTLREEAFAALAKLRQGGEKFGLVIADPPNFVKSRKELKAGARGYRKLTRLLCPVVEPGGFLFLACCSHHVDAPLFAQEIAAGLSAEGRSARILATGGAGPDHPVHPHLPESAYLKYQLLQLD